MNTNHQPTMSSTVAELIFRALIFTCFSDEQKSSEESRDKCDKCNGIHASNYCPYYDSPPTGVDVKCDKCDGIHESNHCPYYDPPLTGVDVKCDKCDGSHSSRVCPHYKQSSAGGGVKCDKCDKCDGSHPTWNCPYYRHTKNLSSNVHSAQNRAGEVQGRVIRQPGDGSCLFHSLAFGLGHTFEQATSSQPWNFLSRLVRPSNGLQLRSAIADWIDNHYMVEFNSRQIGEWIRMDSHQSVHDYTNRLRSGLWGGAIEILAYTHLYHANVRVYEKVSGRQNQFSLISSFDSQFPAAPGDVPITVNIVYQGRVHYDALVL